MNVTELARKLRYRTEDLKQILPEFGFDIGMRAIKVDDRIAQQIIKAWPNITRELDRRERAAKAERAAEEKKRIQETAAPVALPAIVTVREFALRLGQPVTRIIAELMKNGILASLNERVDFETASIIAEDLGFKVVSESGEAAESAGSADRLQTILGEEKKEALAPRPPVVVVMGHVDHGKTKLLDAIRKTNVMGGEAGGITQHIGAYQAAKDNRLITFIDTPGHEAFTAMRSRGAKVADVAILVVAADDGVQPQTKEAIKILEAAKTPFVVAINKIDKPEADQERVKRELSDLGVIPEEWGGKFAMLPISAKTGAGIDKLLELVLLVADYEKEKLLANPGGQLAGAVIESHVDKGEGPVATVLIQNGTLKNGDILAVGGAFYGRVRAMKDYRGGLIGASPPGTPVRILGFKVAPQVGDTIETAADARELTRIKPVKAASEKIAAVEKPQEEATKEKKLENLIIKADVLGSLEAILVSLDKFSHPEVGINVVAKGLGNVTEVDIMRAEASQAWIAGFGVLVPNQVAELARGKGVEIRTYKVIYHLFEDLRQKLEVKLSPEIVRTDYGDLKILAIFRSERDTQIVGGLVTEGKAARDARVTVRRGGEEIGEGTVMELQLHKRAVAEVPSGSECGVKIKIKSALLADDLLHFYK
ncbi:translation initiation factor IF-2, partial [Patescibacteria group bacterium]